MPLNYKHLHYFWVVAQEGNMTRAALRLNLAVQTISGQLALLEKQIGRTLFTHQGRTLILTESGRIVQSYADQIFQLGEAMMEALSDHSAVGSLRLRAGIADGLPKLLACQLLSAAIADSDSSKEVRLSCDEGECENLIAQLALHRLDVVLADRPAPFNANLRVFSHPLGDFATALFAAQPLADRLSGDFPQVIHHAPIILPTRHYALRQRIEHWFLMAGVTPNIVGEFEDSALLHTFGRSGLGIFPAPLMLSEHIRSQFNARLIAPLDGVSEQIYAIYNDRRIHHPLVERLCANAQTPLSPHETTDTATETD